MWFNQGKKLHFVHSTNQRTHAKQTTCHPHERGNLEERTPEVSFPRRRETRKKNSQKCHSRESGNLEEKHDEVLLGYILAAKRHEYFIQDDKAVTIDHEL